MIALLRFGNSSVVDAINAPLDSTDALIEKVTMTNDDDGDDTHDYKDDGSGNVGCSRGCDDGEVKR